MSSIADLKNKLRVINVEYDRKQHPKLVCDNILRAHERVVALYEKIGTNWETKSQASYIMASKFLSGEINIESDSFDEDRIVFSIDDPILERGGETIFGSKVKFDILLKFYNGKASSQELSHLTWYNLFVLYLKTDLSSRTPERDENWEKLRQFLNRSFMPLYENFSRKMKYVWMETLTDNLPLLSMNPYDKYLEEILNDDFRRVAKLTKDLGIPPHSWFWQRLTTFAVEASTQRDDSYFTSKIPLLLNLLKKLPLFRDECLAKILIRYYNAKNHVANKELKDYVIAPDVWKNPKLKYLNLATKWNLVPSEVWKMVLNWVSEENLKMFFALIQTKQGVADDRLQFWIRYTENITWSKFVLGKNTLDLVKNNRNKTTQNGQVLDVLDFSSEEDFVSELQGAPDNLDAFIIEIGDMFFVEFSFSGNAAYYYYKKSVPFDVTAKTLWVGKTGLKSGHDRIIHRDGWEEVVKSLLLSKGIMENKQQGANQIKALNTAVVTPNLTTLKNSLPANPVNHSFESINDVKIKEGSPAFKRILELAKKFNIRIVDKRQQGGHFWVEYPFDKLGFAEDLKRSGFRWAPKRQAWYLEED